ncbi:glyoxalase [Streptomyces sp. NPDC058770]|uniref:glyoxalase n=1 Tax=unclassified Streptomyces TaxID=2593676 RepID=UPI0036CFB15B
MRKRVLACLLPLAAVSGLLATHTAPTSADAPEQAPAQDSTRIAVGPQYDTTHVYVEPGKVPAFTASWKATFGGTNTAVSVTDVTPTPSRTKSELIFSPVGTLSAFDFQTPVPYPFGAERTGWLVTSMDAGIRHARASGADVIVSPFRDPLGQDAVIQFPGGVNTQIYWHTKAPAYKPLETVPENRVYVSPGAVSAFLRSYLRFTGGSIVSDTPRADAGEIGLTGKTYRRIRLTSPFGKTVVAVSDGHLPYPFGREVTGYQVAHLATTLAKARAAGATVLWGPRLSAGRTSAVVKFPGGYTAEIHDGASR